MTQRTLRRLYVFLAIVALLIAAEVGLNLLRGPEGCVEVVNEGLDPIEGLVLTCGTEREDVARVPAGTSAHIYLGGDGSLPLVLKFRQRGNVLGTYEVAGFNAAYLRRDGLKLVLKIRPGEVERYQDDEEPSTPIASLVHKAWKGIETSLDDIRNQK